MTMIIKTGGFTLIELIVVIVMVALLGAFLAPFMGSALTRSHEPLVNLDHAVTLSSEMAKVVAAYREERPDTYSRLWSSITAGAVSEAVVLSKAICFYNSSFELVCDSSPNTAVPQMNARPKNPPQFLEVTLTSTTNPGESLTHLFPLFPDLSGCKVWSPNGRWCRDLEDGYECHFPPGWDPSGGSSICQSWSEET